MGDWSEIEIYSIVEDYFKMLFTELKGEKYSKTEHRKNLHKLIPYRSEGAIEFKHQNISAVLINLGQLYIKGYLPRFNYQKVLEDKVVEYLHQNKSAENSFKHYVEKEPTISEIIKFEKLIVKAPSVNSVTEPPPAYLRNPVKINYLEKEQRNLSLGILGEELVLAYEKWYLIKVGKEKLADEVRWVSKEEGDGSGFDILSKNIDGTDKYVEVKTTKLGKETPFFFSRNELLFSETKAENYHLFRLFNFENKPQLFIKNGNLRTICRSVPINFKGYF